MIRCLPSSPGYACVTRTDWMISLIFRSKVCWVCAVPSVVSRRCRTSCWVMVLAPRGRPRTASRAAAMMPTGSKPLFSQNVRSSMDVVASTSAGGRSANRTVSRLKSPNRASSILPVRS